LGSEVKQPEPWRGFPIYQKVVTEGNPLFGSTGRTASGRHQFDPLAERVFLQAETDGFAQARLPADAAGVDAGHLADDHPALTKTKLKPPD
jgi:hypothetical protein